MRVVVFANQVQIYAETMVDEAALTMWAIRNQVKVVRRPALYDVLLILTFERTDPKLRDALKALAPRWTDSIFKD